MGIFGKKKDKRIDGSAFGLKIDEVFQSVGKNIFDTSDMPTFLKQTELFRSKLTAMYMAAMNKKDYTEQEVHEFAKKYLGRNGIALNEAFIKEHYQEAVELLKDKTEVGSLELTELAKVTMKDVKMSEDMLKKTVDKVLKNLG